ncbi:MAG: phosphate ABC transporter ATPase [Clostridia bacterium]|nr:phosphate ABC transporter ATPase [Clostridia bacterium]
MEIQIGNFDFTEVWDGVLYKKLSHYPQVTDWEIRTLIEFTDYERRHGRECTFVCEDAALLETARRKMTQRERYLHTPRPELITECTACRHGGCRTDLVCHTASPENARSILASGWLLSAVKARGVPAAELAKESRNAANDPADYFDYVMLSWGNCQAGDRLVMERLLGRFPTEEELDSGFTPGVRFYFTYDALAQHPDAVFDGVLPMKVRDGIELEKWVQLILIPESHRQLLEGSIPERLRSRVRYVTRRGEDLWAWAEKVYGIAREHLLPQQ